MKPRNISVLYGIVGLLLLGTLIYLVITLVPEIKHLVANSEEFKAYLKSYGPFAAVIFMLLQIAQVVIPAVPNEIINFAGGYVFGTWQGTLYTVLGIFLGSTIAFALARWIGVPLVKLLVPEKQYKKFEFIFSSKKAALIVLLLFFIPGLPKDLLTYMSGLTSIRPLTFLAITTIVRFPANFMAAYMGANLINGNTNMVIAMAVVVLVAMAVAFVFRERIINWARTLE